MKEFISCLKLHESPLTDMAASSAAPDFSEASLNTLQLALRTMKERCRGQEARIGELEDDNSHLRADRSVRRCFSISVPNYV